MMLLGVCALPRHKPVEWTADCGRGYSLRITPSLYHKSGVVEVYDYIYMFIKMLFWIDKTGVLRYNNLY